MRARCRPLVPGLPALPPPQVEEVLLVADDAERPVGVLSSTLQMPWARRAEKPKRDDVRGVIRSFGIERFRHHRVAELSTGTRRVVDLASIVLARPRLLLLDEPTAGIAQREAEAFIPLLRRLHQIADTTVVLVEHDVPLVFALCDTVVMMETGRVVSVGTPDEVRTTRGPSRPTSARATRRSPSSGPRPCRWATVRPPTAGVGRRRSAPERSGGRLRRTVGDVALQGDPMTDRVASP